MANEEAANLTDPRRWLVLAVVCSALCAIVIDNTILAIAVPSIGEQLGADETDLQWITTAYALVLSGLLLPLAIVGDRYGRRRCFVLGLLVFGAASAAAATVDTPVGLVVCRGLMGAGGAAAMPATLAIIGNVFAPRERPRALSVWSGVAGFAAAAGPLVGGLLLAQFWWGSVFLVNVPVVIVGVVAALVLVPESRDPVPGRIDWAGAALWTGALVSVLFGIIEGPERGWSSGAVLGPLAVAVILLSLFVRHVVRAPMPLLSPATARHPGMRSGASLVTAAFFALLGSQFILTQWLQGPRALGTLAASACFLPNAVASMGSSFANPRLVARVGEVRSVRFGAIVMTAGLAGLGVGIAADSLALVVVAFAAAGLGQGFVVPTGIELIMRSAPAARAGEAAGVNETIIEAGGALGVAVMGSVLVGASSHAAPMGVAAAGLALGAIVAQRVQRRAGLVAHA
jgi:DHA2 family multidrug resistance protein-like MFS transporter